MKVLKFGGSSVGSAEGLSQVKKVVGACTEDAIVVVSALGGITDQLLQTARTAAAGDDGYAASPGRPLRAMTAMPLRWRKWSRGITGWPIRSC